MSETTASVASVASNAAVTPASSSAVVAESATARGRRARIALRALQVVLALFYAIASALPKLIGHSSATEFFADMGWGTAGMYTIGILELAGAVALLVPLLQSLAAISLGALMVGAFIVQLTVFEGQNAATPLILLVPLALIAWARRGQNAELLMRVLRRRG
ncbi:DoxX family protein [Streptomyces sp. TRM70350]|uniref:DoxX family protein n=1 Tax=Streptomyces sp. TRM70350 TaxID=2856165 RepID=UPI001C45D2A1|nr:DoxX family protein [Streptomyces sp. TRM70350]MBV7694997.1 DoxX family protein [Streptomyces sp. TRM70350]